MLVTRKERSSPGKHAETGMLLKTRLASFLEHGGIERDKQVGDNLGKVQ